jgi:hypothetical protein
MGTIGRPECAHEVENEGVGGAGNIGEEGLGRFCGEVAPASAPSERNPERAIAAIAPGSLIPEPAVPIALTVRTKAYIKRKRRMHRNLPDTRKV